LPFRFSKIMRSILLRCIVIPFIFSLGMTFVLQHIESTQIEQLTFTTTITISNETRYGSPCKAFVKKGWFDSAGEVYAYMSSPYASYWNTFNIWMSLDNSSWTPVPFLESDTDNLTQMASLGFINLGNPQLTIYLKYYIPPQTILLPSGVTKEDASILKSNVLIKKRATPADRMQWITIFLAVFAFIGYILNSFLLLKKLRKEERSPLSKLEKRRDQYLDA